MDEIEQARLGVIERLEVAHREVEEAGAHGALDARAAYEALSAHFGGLGVDVGHAASDLCLAILEASERSIGDLDKKMGKLGKARVACQKSSAELGPMPSDITERSAWLEQHGTLTGRMQGIELQLQESHEQRHLIQRLVAGAFGFDLNRGRAQWGRAAELQKRLASDELLATFPTFAPTLSVKELRVRVGS